MSLQQFHHLLCAAALAACCLNPAKAGAGDPLELGGGRVVVETPEAWQVAEKKSPILEAELSVPSPAESGVGPARLTMMAAGGSVEANINRWIGQFKNTEGGADRSSAEIKTVEVNGGEATLIEVSGEYLDGRPFGPKTPRANYRLLGAIVPLGSGNSYFFKMIGPAETVGAAADDFRAMIKAMEVR